MDELLHYYKECFAMMDMYHFNSDMTRKQYEKVLGSGIGKTVAITHSEIKDNRSIKTFSENGLIVGFIGNKAPYKGFQLLTYAIEGFDIDVMVWGGKKTEDGRIHYRGKFGKEQLHDVYWGMDLLVVPSICKETFSLVTLEALSFGVPVLVSDNVGAQDLVTQYAPEFVYHSPDELRVLLSKLVADKSCLIEYNKRICELPWKHAVMDHAREVIENIYLG